MRHRLNHLAGGLLAALVVANVLTLVAWPLDLFPDEAYYWDWSRHPSLCYVSKGPLVALIIGLSTRLCGTNELAIRLPAVLLGATMTWLVYRFVARFGTARAALWALGALLLLPIFNGGQLFMTTDPPLMACWAAALLAVGEALEGEEAGAPTLVPVLAGGLVFGLGVLAKPTMLLFLVPVALVVVRRRRAMSWLRRPETWLAAGLALALLSPMLLWNATHGWPTARHVWWQTTQEPGWHPRSLEFIGFQTMLVTPWVLVLMLGAALAVVRAPRGAAEELAAWSFLVVLGLFALKSIESDVEANWPAPAYLGGVAVAAWRWGRSAEVRSRFAQPQRLAIAWAVALGLAFRLLPAAYYIAPSQLLRSIDLTRRAVGWRSFGAAIDEGRAAIAAGGDPAGVPIAALHYQPAAAAAYYATGRPRTTVLSYPGRPEYAYDEWSDVDLHRALRALLIVRGEAEAPPVEAQGVLAGWRRLRVVELRAGRQVMDRYTLFEITPGRASR